MTSPGIYTVVLDYNGRTYISQVPAESPPIALERWLAALKDDELAVSGITRKKLTRIKEDENLVDLDGCVNVWCISGSGEGRSSVN
jgi:hypothetical protein